jgi:hypothetical protein
MFADSRASPMLTLDPLLILHAMCWIEFFALDTVCFHQDRLA